ncbi:MAG: hypothetical protein H0W62_05975 [Chitinophagales bacterium]|nr:hypothetical protein [Chitinophagales bacterium]
MRKFWPKIRTVLTTVAWIICGCGVMILSGAALLRQQNLKLKTITVNVDQSDGMLFVNPNDILQILKDHRVNIESASLDQLNYQNLERTIQSNPWVKHAELFVNTSGNLDVNVTQRKPVLRVINNQGVSYYIDDHSMKMPVSNNFTARVPVATGCIFSGPENHNTIDSVTEQKLFILACYVQSDSFLSSLTEQIVVNTQKEFELIPLLGNQTILIGDTDSLQQKFNKLKIFYKEGMDRLGWPDYKTINLKYTNEVFCEKRDPVKTGTFLAQRDSTKSNRPTP